MCKLFKLWITTCIYVKKHLKEETEICNTYIQIKDIEYCLKTIILNESYR